MNSLNLDNIKNLFEKRGKAKFTHGGKVLTFEGVDYLVASINASGVQVEVTGIVGEAIEGYGTDCIKWDRIEA